MVRQRIVLISAVILLQITNVLGTDCNWHYFKHYEQKGCTAVLGPNGCPIRFQCPKLSSDDLKTCVHNGKTYEEGDEIKDVGPCDSCSCEVDKDGAAFIECASVDCPDWEPQNKSCYMGYKPGECCPTETCPAGHKDKSKRCLHNGQEYKTGLFIQTSEPCKTCICTEDWAGENGPGCSTVNCLTGVNAKKIRKGCLPIYSEKGCCASQVICGDLYGATPAILNDKRKDNYCYYQGIYYDKGSIARLKSDKYQCMTCRCTTPPDFTCLRKTCPEKPNPDCKTVYGFCCPEYECP